MILSRSAAALVKAANLTVQYYSASDLSEDSEWRIFKDGKDTLVRVQICDAEIYETDKDSYFVCQTKNVGPDKFAMIMIGDTTSERKAFKMAVEFVRGM